MSAVPFSAIPAIAMGIPPMAAERKAAAMKKTPTPGWKNGELTLASDQAAAGSSRVTIQAPVRRCAMGELGKSEISVQKTIPRIVRASQSIARIIRDFVESLVVVHRDSIKAGRFSKYNLPDNCDKSLITHSK